MKRIFTILILSCLIVGMTSQCSEKIGEPIVETIYTAEYIFRNNTTKEVTIRCYEDSYVDNEYYYDRPQEIISIAPDEEHTECYSYMGGGFAEPFFEYRVLYIEDGEYRVKHKFSEGLFIEDNYVLKTEREWYREYVFTFTDDFFKDGNPVDAPLR